MPTKQTLERLNITVLAVLCTGIASDPITYTRDGAERARKLKEEWHSLVAGGRELTPKASELKKQKLAALKKRMTSFLAGIV